MKEVPYNVCHISHVNHIIFIANVRTFFGQRSTELLGHRTDSDIYFFLKLAPLVDTHPKPCPWNIRFICEHSNVRIICEYLTIFAKNTVC